MTGYNTIRPDLTEDWAFFEAFTKRRRFTKHPYGLDRLVEVDLVETPDGGLLLEIRDYRAGRPMRLFEYDCVNELELATGLFARALRAATTEVRLDWLLQGADERTECRLCPRWVYNGCTLCAACADQLYPDGGCEVTPAEQLERLEYLRAA